MFRADALQEAFDTLSARPLHEVAAPHVQQFLDCFLQASEVPGMSSAGPIVTIGLSSSLSGM